MAVMIRSGIGRCPRTAARLAHFAQVPFETHGTTAYGHKTPGPYSSSDAICVQNVRPVKSRFGSKRLDIR